MANDTLFTLDHVWLKRPGEKGQEQTILAGVAATVTGSGITCLVGPSGAGKSTLLRLLNRLEDPTEGRILLHGEDLQSLDPLALRRRVGLVQQLPTMLPGSVLENLSAGLRIRGKRLAEPERWLARVGLAADLLNRAAADLSGGEKQRVALARTLVTEPEVLLLDEVTASLDPDSAQGVEELIVSLRMPAVWVSHDPNQVRRVADRILRLQDGLISEEVPA